MKKDSSVKKKHYPDISRLHSEPECIWGGVSQRQFMKILQVSLFLSLLFGLLIIFLSGEVFFGAVVFVFVWICLAAYLLFFCKEIIGDREARVLDDYVNHKLMHYRLFGLPTFKDNEFFDEKRIYDLRRSPKTNDVKDQSIISKLFNWEI